MGVNQDRYREFNSANLREQRLVFAQAGASTRESGSEKPSKDWKNYTTHDAYVAALQKLLDDGEITNEESTRLLSEGKKARKEAENKMKQKTENPNLQKIDEARKKETSTNTIRDRAVSQVEEKYIDDLQGLRNFIRKEIKSLGIVSQTNPSEEELNKLKIFSNEVEKRVISILETSGIDMGKIKKEAEAERKLAIRCLQRMQALSTVDKRPFLDALRNKGIPPKTCFDINTILKYGQSITDPDGLSLVGVTGKDLFLLEQALDTIENLERRWGNAKAEDVSKLKYRLEQLTKNIGNLKFDVEQNKDQAGYRELHENWGSYAKAKNDDIAHFRKMLTTPGLNDNDRKLIDAFLNGNEEEIKTMQDDFRMIREAKQRAEIARKEEERRRREEAGEKEDEDEDEEKEPHAPPAPTEAHEEELGEGHHANAFTKFGKLWVKTFTANGRIVWYSWHDIAESFKLIKNSWEKHYESASEDKRAPLAKGVMFWKQEVERRIHHIDLSAEKSRADELKKTYKNYTDKELIAELAEKPAKDRRRAILESLADRGNLRMSNKKLIAIVCGENYFTKKDWEEADAKIDYMPMRDAFKKAIDKSFIGEIGYGKELLAMHNAGFEKAEGNGKKYSSSNEAGSTRMEVGSINSQIKRVHLEGEGTIAGMIAEIVDRANAFSDNGQFADATIRIDGAEKSITRSSDMGLVGLLITDAFFRGDLSREMMMKIGKGHEQCFRPFATFQQVVGAKEKTDPLNPKKKISHFEYWGWVNDKGITELGATQIINFFNGRNAIAEIEVEKGKYDKEIIHMANDSNFAVHSGQRVTGIEQARRGVGDKFAGYVTKASSIDVIEQATTLRRDTGSATGELREITSLIKAGVEDFIDGKLMMDSKERYFDSFTGKEIVQQNGKWCFIDADTRKIDEKAMKSLRERGEEIGENRVIEMGKARMERGTEILLRILKNMWLYREDRKILESSYLYKIYDPDTTENGTAWRDEKANAQSKLISGTLRDLLEKSIGAKWGNTKEYQEIMKAYGRLEDPNEKLTRADIDEARRRSGNIEKKSDLDHPAPKNQTPADMDDVYDY